jgi:outer membrane protein assembly factor BamB
MKISRQIIDEPCPQWQHSLAAIDQVDLSPERRVALRQHLVECPQCQAVDNAYRSMDVLFTSLPVYRALDGVPARLQELLEVTDKGNMLVQNETLLPQHQPAPRRRALSQGQIEGRRSHPLMKTFNQVAIILVLCTILGGFLVLEHVRQNGTIGSSNGAPSVYMATIARPSMGIALNTIDGTPNWQTPLSMSLVSPVVSQGNVYFASEDGNIYAIRTSNGKSLWHTRVGSGMGVTSYDIPSGFVVYENQIITGTSGGDVYALNALTGSLTWKTHVAACDAKALSTSGGSGTFQFNPCYVSLKQQVDGVIYGDAAGLYAWNASTGKVIWYGKDTSLGYLPFLVASHAVYAAVADKTGRTIDVLDSRDGHYIRAIHMSAAVKAIRADTNTLYVLSVKTGRAADKTVVDVSDQLHAYKLSDGTQLWQKTSASDQVFDSFTLAGGHLYVLINLRTPGYGDIASRSPEDTVYAFNPANGSQLWKSQQFSGLGEIFAADTIIGLAQSNGVVPNSKEVIYDLQPDDGSVIWHFSLNGLVARVIVG